MDESQTTFFFRLSIKSGVRHVIKHMLDELFFLEIAMRFDDR